MKKILLICLALIIPCALCLAEVNYFEGVEIDNTSTIEGTAGCSEVEGQTITPASCTGNKGSEDLTSAGSTDLLYTTKYVHSGTCTINTLELYAGDDDATEFVMAIYDESGGEPNNLLAQTSTVASVGAKAWRSGTISETMLEDGVTYFFAFQGDDVVKYNYLTGSSGDTYYRSYTYDGTMPDPLTLTSASDRIIAFRASFQ